MSKKTNVIYVLVNQDLKWIKDENLFVINQKDLNKKRIKPWKSKCGTKLLYQLFNPSTNSRVVYSRPESQELIKQNGVEFNEFYPETEIETIKITKLRIIK